MFPIKRANNPHVVKTGALFICMATSVIGVKYFKEYNVNKTEKIMK